MLLFSSTVYMGFLHRLVWGSGLDGVGGRSLCLLFIIVHPSFYLCDTVSAAKLMYFVKCHII